MIIGIIGIEVELSPIEDIGHSVHWSNWRVDNNHIQQIIETEKQAPK